jgi:hypothetical protein
MQVDGKRMITGDILARSPAITFLWVKRFPLGEQDTSLNAFAEDLCSTTPGC